jgi:hypothetical protein
VANISREERLRRQADAKQGEQFGGAAYEGMQAQVDELNRIDERRPDWRPATIVNHDTQEMAPDDRGFAGDVGKAANLMVGRAWITENHDPLPGVTAAENLPVTQNVHGAYDGGSGEEIQLLRGYVPADAELVNGQAVKRQRGEVLRLPSKEAKKLVNAGAAKFTETD